MELFFLWIEDDFINLKNTLLSFSNEYEFRKVEEDSKKIFYIKETNSYLPQFFNRLFKEEEYLNSDLVNVSGIIGENGSGKTNICFTLIDILSGTAHLPYNYVIGFRGNRKNKIIIYSNLTETKIEFKSFNNIVIEKIDKYRLVGSIYGTNPFAKEFNENSISIYYNPILDFRDYPQSFSNNNKSYIDISTNSLIEGDFVDYYEENDERDDKLLIHKYANIQRQFSFITTNNKSLVSELNLPTEVIIRIKTRNFEEVIRNIPQDNVDYFEYIKKGIGNRKGKLLSDLERINDEINTASSYSSFTDFFSDQTKNKPQNNEILSVKKKILFINFCDQLLNNIFINTHNAGFERKIIDISHGEYNINEIEKFLDDFFLNVMWKSVSNNKGSINELYKNMLETINNIDFIEHIIDDEYSFICSVKEAHQLLKIHRNYISSIPSDRKQAVINFDWRNISSGEKAMLDLYSRLFFAFNNVLQERERIRNKDFDFIYLFVDEGEMGFHPQWQKEYLYNLIKFVKLFFKGVPIQLFITSHSPFIISDLPKKNLIFLHKVGSKTEVIELGNDTSFASNIHTLYTDSYFIKSGIKGKFSEEWLNKELKDLFSNKKRINFARIRKVISLIGEPVLRNSLNDLLKKKQENDVSGN